MERLLAGKSALITGGGGGIGRATALAFAREGAQVAIADLSDVSARETVAAVEAAGGEAMSIRCDVSRNDDVQAMVDAVVKAYGKLDCAFNNAGIGAGQIGMSRNHLGDWTEEAFDRIVSTNLKGVWLCMKHELRYMTARGGGAIVNSGSVAALVGVAGTAGYNASKHGVIGLTQTAAVEYSELKIRVNAVCPGPIKTAMNQSTVQESSGLPVPAILTAPRGRPEDVAEMVVFLCSERSAFITGAAIPIDGGWLAQ